MLVSHEMPPSLFKEFGNLNDYEYILPTLWGNKEYKDYMLEYRRNNGFIIMDNGLFENGNLSNKELINIINEVVPNIFIVPDTWNDSNDTYKKAKYWKNTLNTQLPSITKLMVVMQGNSLHEFEHLYENCVELGYKHFAFNHSSKAYSLMFNHPNDLVNKALGRVETITSLRRVGYIRDNHYIHLLGCSLINELFYYNSSFYNFIDSIDTSSPIVLGALGKKYDLKNLIKPKEKIEEFYDKDLTSKIKFINYNINKFKEMINGGK